MIKGVEMHMKKVPCSKRIKKGLEIRGLKQSDLCRITGIPKSAMSQYIKGTFEPRQDRVYLIAKALDVSEAWLMGFDVSMNGSSLASRLKQAMDERDVTVGYLAELTGLSKETIIKYLQNDNITPKHDEIKSICNALNINEAWLLGHQYIGIDRKPPAVAGNQYEKSINEDWLDALCEDENENSDLRMLITIARTISPEKLKQLREMAQVMFPDAYCQ